MEDGVLAMDDLVSLLAAALTLMGSPGPGTLSLAAVGSVFGMRRGLPYLAGMILGTTGVVVLVATGVTGMVLAVPALLPVLGVLALGYLLWLAYRIATAPILVETGADDADGAEVRRPSFTGAFLLGIANPKAYGAISAVFTGTVLVPGDPLADAAGKALVLAGVVVLSTTLWLALGARFARALRTPRTGRVINVLFAVLLLGSVVLVLMV